MIFVVAIVHKQLLGTIILFFIYNLFLIDWVY